MALLDPMYFDPRTFTDSGPGGLLARIQQMAQMPQAPQGQGAFPPANAGANAQLPANAAPTQGQMPTEPSWLDGLSGGLSNNSQTLLALGAGLMQGGFGKGLQLAAATAGQRPGSVTDDIKEFEYARKNGFAGGFTDWMAKKKAVSGEYGMTPIWGTGPDGKPAIIQLGKNGEARQATLPDGVSLSRDPIKLDAGTHFVILDPQTRQPVGTVPKDLKGAEVAKAEGKGAGEASVEYDSIASKMPGLMSVVQKLNGLADKATYTYAGQALDAGMRQAGMEPRDAAIARAEYTSIVDNQILPLLRDTFGAQFTQKEGETLRATLGDPNKSPKEKQALLSAFIEQKKRDIEALAQRTGRATPSFTPGGGGQSDPLGIR